MVELENEDVLDYLKTIKDNSIDYILTDPPYGINYVNMKWDQFKNEEEYLDWCEKWTKECVRVLKPGRMMSVFGTLKTDTFVKYKLFLDSILNRQSEICWSYNWGGRTKKNFGYKHEFIWNASKGKDFLFNPVFIERKTKNNPRTGKAYEKGTIPVCRWAVNTDTPELCVWEKNNHTMSKEYQSAKWHPTKKPIIILERLIEAYSNPGDIVLDIFSGSGSTAIACINTDRSFKGCELDEEYFMNSLERIEELSEFEW